MKYRLLDILACPICKNFPLEHYVIEETTYENRVLEGEEKPLCELYCGYLGKKIKDLKETPCRECFKKEIKTGALYCSNCGRWYPIIDEIPQMLPDELRDKKLDVSFLGKYKDQLPDKIALSGKPYNLKASL